VEAPWADLRAAVGRLLEQAGILPGRINHV
jgi:hypothetical protein